MGVDEVVIGRQMFRYCVLVVSMAVLLLLLLVLVSRKMSADDYHDYDGIVTQIKTWEQDPKYEEIVKITNLSEIYDVENTYEGRNLWLITISDEDTVNDDGENESQLLFLGGLEGRNWISVEICMGVIQEFIEDYQNDARITALINNSEICIIPMMNPDGSQFSRENDDPLNEGEDGWIKNRNNTHGTNINRNFDILWNRDLESGINDTSGNPNDFSYAGKSAASEYESQALISLIEDESFTSIVLFDDKGTTVSTIPFAKDEAPFAADESHLQNTEDEEKLNMMASYLTSFLGYTVVEVNPYIISGDFLDWCYDEHGLLSVKIAVGDSYIPSPDTIDEITANYTEMCLNAGLVILEMDFPDRTWYVDDSSPDGGNGSQERPFNKIQDAINASLSGDTVYVYPGTYYENIVVDKTINLTSESRDTVVIDGGGKGDVVRVEADWCNVSGFSIKNSGNQENESGIRIESSHNRIFKNSCSNNNNGICVTSNVTSISIPNGDFDDGWEHWTQTTSIRGKNDGTYEITTEEHGDWKVYDGPTAGLGPDRDNVASGGSNGRDCDGKLVSDSFVIGQGTDYIEFWHHAKWWNFEYADESWQDEFSDIVAIRLVEVGSEDIVAQQVYQRDGAGGGNTEGEEEGILQFDVSAHGGKEVRLEMEVSTNRPQNDDGLVQIDKIEFVDAGKKAKNNIIQYNDIYDNFKNGISVSMIGDIYLIDAEHNWWGDRSGPYHPTKNAEGKGDSITEHVTFDNWLLAPFDNEKPVVTIKSITPATPLSDQMVTFKGEAIDDGNIVRYVWQSSLDGELHNDTTSDFSTTTLSNGTHTIYFSVADNWGIWSEEVLETVTVNGKPVARIASITPNPALEDEKVWFNATGIDDGSVVRYVWTSNKNGEFYNGTKNYTTSSELSLGAHTITLLVQDDEGVWSRKVWTAFQATNKPIAVIREVRPEGYALDTQTVYFTAEGRTKLPATITRYIWRSSRDGVFYNDTENHFSCTNLSNGTHTIDLKVKNSDNIYSEEVTATLIVNGAPTANIVSSPATLINEGDEVRLVGGGHDDGEIVRYRWESSLDDVVYGGPSEAISLYNLSNGTHTLYLRVQDDYDEWSEGMSAILTINGRPRAEIVTNEGTKAFENLATDPVYLKGEGTDDGGIMKYRWESHKAGPIGNQAELYLHNLTGTHIITFMVQDDHGVWSEPVTGTINVTRKPTVSLSVSKSTPDKDEEITFDASSWEDDGEVVEFLFDFGDGSDSGWVTTPTVTHTYSEYKSFSAKVKVKDDTGLQSSWSKGASVDVQKPESEATLLGLTRIQLTAISVTVSIIAAFVGLIIKTRAAKSLKSSSAFSEGTAPRTLAGGKAEFVPEVNGAVIPEGKAEVIHEVTPMKEPESPLELGGGTAAEEKTDATFEKTSMKVQTTTPQSSSFQIDPESLFKPSEAPPATPPAAQGNWICSQCKKEVGDKFGFCVYCGSKRSG